MACGAAEPAGRRGRQASGARRSTTRLTEPPTGLAEPPSWHARSLRADRRSRRAGRRSRPPPAGRASERAGRAAELVGGASKLAPSQRGALHADLGKTQGFFWAARSGGFCCGRPPWCGQDPIVQSPPITGRVRACFLCPGRRLNNWGGCLHHAHTPLPKLCKMLMCVDYDVTYETRCVS